MKSVQLRSFFWSVFSSIRPEYGAVFSLNAGKYGPEKTPYLDTFYTVPNYQTNVKDVKISLKLKKHTKISMGKARSDDPTILQSGINSHYSNA